MHFKRLPEEGDRAPWILDGHLTPVRIGQRVDSAGGICFVWIPRLSSLSQRLYLIPPSYTNVLPTRFQAAPHQAAVNQNDPPIKDQYSFQSFYIVIVISKLV